MMSRCAFPNSDKYEMVPKIKSFIRRLSTLLTDGIEFVFFSVTTDDLGHKEGASIIFGKSGAEKMFHFNKEYFSISMVSKRKENKAKDMLCVKMVVVGISNGGCEYRKDIMNV